jgi:NhaA family Na+:H+ antiporter
MCTAFSLLLANTAFGHYYSDFFQHQLFHAGGLLSLPASASGIINDGLMTIFFFAATLEIKNEMLNGQLNSFRKAIMPVISATGGMLLPAAIYILCSSHENFRGWAIPMSTDIAFSLVVISLLGDRLPMSVRTFLLAIAIIDDLGGIIAIAFFYAHGIHLYYALGAAVITLTIFVKGLLNVRRAEWYLAAGVLLWYMVYNSGIHATIAGALIALAMPASISESYKIRLYVPVNFIIMPLFALANTIVMLRGNISSIIFEPIHYAIFAGLVIGKPLGIFGFTLLAAKVRIASIPTQLKLKHLLGVGLTAGVGFTVSIFVATLAFTDTQTQIIAKIAVLNASIFSGVIAYCYLRLTNPVKQYSAEKEEVQKLCSNSANQYNHTNA